MYDIPHANQKTIYLIYLKFYPHNSKITKQLVSYLSSLFFFFSRLKANAQLRK